MRLIKPSAFVFSLAVLTLAVAGSPELRQRVAAQSFDVCLEDDSNKASAVRFNSSTGEYMVCAGGTSFMGRGSVTSRGGIITLQHSANDRRLTARTDTSAKVGSSSFQSPPGKTLGTVRDTNTANSTCGCR